LILERFVESIRNGSAPPVSAEEGRETVRVLNMIVEKLGEKHGRRVCAASTESRSLPDKFWE
jgi:hypothetical protein